MQRLQWHCHTKGVSGALYKAIGLLFHSQSAGKEMANSAVFNLWRNAGSDWISLTEVGRELQARDAAARNARSQWWRSTCRWYDECRRRSRPETRTTLYISRRLECLSKVRWRSTMEATMRQNTQTNCILSGTFNHCRSRRYKWRDVFWPPCREHQLSSGIQHRLQALQECIRYTSQC